MNPDTKLIASLVSRILVKLPNNNGNSPHILENDPLVSQTVTSLIELSKFRLPMIASTLIDSLDRIKMPPNEEYFPYENLQSQLFILRILSACMQHHWQYACEKPPSDISLAIGSVGDISHHHNSSNSLTDSSLSVDMIDPPPFDDKLAKNLINVMSRIMRQTTIMEEREYGQATNHVTQMTRSEYYTSSNIFRISADIVLDIYKASSRVVAYLSASNWNAVFTKLKIRIAHLVSASDENPETSDMRLLECCSLNSKRLSTVLTELRLNFPNLKKSTQLIVAAILRRAIWGWIETYSSEFIQLCQKQKRLEGEPDDLFETCLSLADTTRKKAILWPLQTMLLILCPDILYTCASPDGPLNINSKKATFLATLKASLKPGRMAELAAICYVDICKAATFISKTDSSALRHIVSDIGNELRGQLFDSEKPLITDSLMSGLGIIIDHRSLLADCLVAMFRLNPHHAIHSLFPSCLESRAPTLFKISLVKACLAIASEKNRLPWNPSASTLYESLPGYLKKLFIDYAGKDFSKTDNTVGSNNRKVAPSNSTNDRKLRKESKFDQNERLELMLDMLRLYQTDPRLAIEGEDSDRFEMNASLMVAIANCLREQDLYVKDAAAACLVKLHSPDYIIGWNSSPKFMESFWKISSQVVFTLAKLLLDNREKDDGLKRLLELVQKLFEARNEFFKRHQDVAMLGSDTRERLQASIGLEVALLVLLCSSDIGICTSAITCFGHICIEAQFTESIDDPNQAILMVVENLPIYQQLSSNNNLITGRKSQQKQIRKLLRMMTHFAPGNLAAWEEAYKRWKYMTPAVIKPLDEPREDTQEITSNTNSKEKRGGQAWHDKLRNTTSSSSRQTNTFTSSFRSDTISLDEDKSSEWQNYAGFLAALGGICIMADVTAPAFSSSIASRSGHNDQSTFRRISAPTESSAMVSKFVIDMVDLLLCDNVIVREWVKEILGTDLSPALYPMLFRHVEAVLAKYFGSDGDPICNQRNTLFVEQAISILKLILDRMDASSENLLAVDFSGLMNLYVKYLNKLGSGQSALKIKIKFCQLTEILMKKKEQVTLRQEFRLRNKLLEIIVEWTSDFSLKPEASYQYSTFETNQGEKLHKELDLACLNTIVGLLHQLPLQSSEPVHETDSTPIKSKIFFNYFTFFLKLLNRCRDSENEVDSSPHRSRQYSDVHSNVKNKENMSTYLAPLKESTILAMSNLLSANVDAGLKHSLSMGYHEDPQMRAAFMKVLTNILNQGTEFETLAETVMTDRYEKLVDMLVEDDLNIALSLCDVCPASDIEDSANALLACFTSRGKAIALLKAVIQKEVQNTDSETELLRRTSIATRLLSVFAKQYGAEYVRSVLQPVFLKLSEKPPEERTFELDSSKAGSGEDVSKNKQNVVNATEMFLNAICASANEAPVAFREVCHCILTSVRERYPEAKYTAVGAFIFLRFFCPAIVSPESDGIVKNATVSRDMKRGHLIATKVIQNLANNVLFGAKETYMIVLNDFLTNNIYKVTSFLREISNVADSNLVRSSSLHTNISAISGAISPRNYELDAIDTRPMEAKDYSCLHRVLFDNMERISRELTARSMRQCTDNESATSWKRQFDRFSNLLAQLGRPPEISKQEFSGLRSYTFAAANQLYAEFMRRNSHRNVEAIVAKNIFYEGGTSKANRPVFYFIARNIVSDSIDFDLLIYHMLQIMERASNKSLELVLDITLFSSSNEIPLRYINQILQLLPFDATDNIANILVYNPNSHFCEYIYKLKKHLPQKLTKRTFFAVTLTELYDFISSSEVRLPKSTTSLDTEQCQVFHPVNKLTQDRINIPITFKVSSDYVQIITVKKQEISYNLTTVINDVYLITDIEVEVNKHKTDGEFQFKYNKGEFWHTFTSPTRDNIVNTIRLNKRRLEMAKPNSMSERTIRPNDVPGRLLNMALLNIGSDEPSLRLAAYNLLYALSITFQFEVDNQLLDSRDLCLPANSIAFIANISEKIAHNQPNLTLEFLSESLIGFQKSSEPLRYLCLDYMAPWLPNLSRFCQNADNEDEIVKAKEVLRNLIDLTVARTDMYKLVQVKIWKAIGQIDGILDFVLDLFIQFSIEHGLGSVQSEAMTGTFVTMSNIAVRGKVVSRLRKVLQKTSYKPTRSLPDHWAWNEISALIRFVLMVSFNNRGPVKSYVPEIFHIASLLVGVGPTIIRASVHGLVINVIQSLCTAMPIHDGNVKKLQLILSEMSDSKYRLLFGLLKPQANAFSINPETLNDASEPVPLIAHEAVVNNLLEVLTYSAPSADIANAWRARWMSLVASTAFQFNPAIQPQAFVILGCLGREEVDDDILYQILVALRGALAIFNESDPNLVLGILMCLNNTVDSLPSDSRYLLSLFWVAVSLVEINDGPTFPMAVNLLISVLHALDSNECFNDGKVADVLLAARKPLTDVARKLDKLCGVNFDSHFSFAITTILLKGLHHTNAKEAVFQGLIVFLDIECKHRNSDDSNNSQSLGYLAGLLPIAVKNGSLREVLQLAKLVKSDFELDVNDNDVFENTEANYGGFFDRLNIANDTTALLLISALAIQLQMVESANEKLFLYNFLAKTANSLPAIFSVVYETLLPKMNQIVLNSTSQPMIESVKSILLIACSNQSINDTSGKDNLTQKVLLEKAGFPALGDPTFGVTSTNSSPNAKLASEIIELIIA